MGAYYKLVCDELRESIDPGAINNCGIKLGSISFPNHPFGSVSIFAMSIVWGIDYKFRLINDERYPEEYFDYKDITKQIIDRYNDCYCTEENKLQYTGEESK